jgi:hypothetical protein
MPLILAGQKPFAMAKSIPLSFAVPLLLAGSHFHVAKCDLIQFSIHFSEISLKNAIFFQDKSAKIPEMSCF